MTVKLLALGNVLMEDDGIAIVIAESLRERLQDYGITVVIGETDIGYLLCQVEQSDFLIVLDAATSIPCGSIQCFPLEEQAKYAMGLTQHGLSFLQICATYYPEIKGRILGIGVASISCHYGISRPLRDKCDKLMEELMRQIAEGMAELHLSEGPKEEDDGGHESRWEYMR